MLDIHAQPSLHALAVPKAHVVVLSLLCAGQRRELHRTITERRVRAVRAP